MAGARAADPVPQGTASWRELLTKADEVLATPAEVRLLARLLVPPATAQHISKAIDPLELDAAASSGRDLLSLAAAFEADSGPAGTDAGSRSRAAQLAAAKTFTCLELLRSEGSGNSITSSRAAESAEHPCAARAEARPLGLEELRAADVGEVCSALEILCPLPEVLQYTRRLKALHEQRITEALCEPEASRSSPPAWQQSSAGAPDDVPGLAWRCVEASMEALPPLRRQALLQGLQGGVSGHRNLTIANAIESALLDLNASPGFLGSGEEPSEALDSQFAPQKLAKALRQAELAGQPRENVVLSHAKQMAADWCQGLAGTDAAAAVWPAIDNLLSAHNLPPWTAAQFFIHEVDSLAGSEAACLLTLAKSWLVGSKGNRPFKPACPPSLLAALATAIHLCSTQPPPADDWVPLALTEPGRGGSAGYVKPAQKQAGSAPQLWELLEATVKGLIAKATPAAVQGTLRNLLEAGDIVAARGLSELLPSPPIELALVEAAIRVFRTCWGLEPSASEAAPASLVPAAVLAFMTRRGAKITCATELLAALCSHCRDGAGLAVCRWVEVAWQAAGLLGFPCGEIITLGPLSVFEALILRGAPFQLVQDFAEASRLSKPGMGQTIAHLYLKGLMLEQGGGRSKGGVAAEALVEVLHGLSPPVAVANALLEHLVDCHKALEAQAVVEVMLTAHRLYLEAASFAGVDGLLDLALFFMKRWASRGELSALPALIAGLGCYRPIQHAVDTLSEAYGVDLSASLRQSRSAAATRLLEGRSMMGLASLDAASGSSTPDVLAAASAAAFKEGEKGAGRLARFSQMLQMASAFQEASQPRRAAALARMVVQLHDA